MTSETCRSQRIFLHGFVTIAFLVIIVVDYLSEIEVLYVSFLNIYLLSGFSYLVSFVLMRRDVDPRLPVVFEILGTGVLLGVPILIATYMAVSQGMPLADDWLMAMDRRLGFDWVAYVKSVDRYPALSVFMTVAYGAFPILIFLIPLILVASGNAAKACGYMFGFGLICFVSSFIAIWFPAKAAYYSYGLVGADLQNIRPVVGYGFLEHFDRAHTGELKTISIDNLDGILTFPSVHAAVGFWVVWGIWGVPKVRWPLSFLGAAMAVSAISYGGHYLLDIIAGFGVVLVVAAATHVLFMGLPAAERLGRRGNPLPAVPKVYG